MAKGDGRDMPNAVAGVGYNPSFTGINRWNADVNRMSYGQTQGSVGPSMPPSPPNTEVSPTNAGATTKQYWQPRNDMGSSIPGMGLPYINSERQVPGSAGTVAPSGNMYSMLFNLFGRQ